ncbi:calcium-activated potassium channel subunit alpha-1-like [Aplochiton taeniatus]
MNVLVDQYPEISHYHCLYLAIRKNIVAEPVFSLRSAVREWSVSFINAQHLPGQVLIVLIFCTNIGSIFIYLILTTHPVEYCVKEFNIVFLIDVTFNVLYLLYFGLRLLAAKDKLKVWVEVRSLVDFFTIIPTFVTLYTYRAWLGLRFIRALHILELPVILQILNILNSNKSLKLSRLVSILIATWLTSAGLIHIVETSGDPWLDHFNGHAHSYFECIYFIIVTMSTVGYGDVRMTTTCGLIFLSIFICIGLALFASYVPEVAEIIINRKKHGGRYTLTEKTHVVVCGHITLASASDFMKEFLHEDRGEFKIDVLFLGNFCPDPELEAFFRRHSLQVTFFQGSVRLRKDQQRVMMDTAAACLILCDRFTPEQDKEDSDQLLSVISIKTYCPNTRIIVQMLKHSSKAFVQKVPDWDWSRGDAVMCLAELKLGFMAQSCQVPGLSTLLANLFTIQKEVEKRPGNKWQSLYLEGLYNEIYTEYLSNAFVGLSFAQASKMCYLKLKLMLIGLQYETSYHESSVVVNPPGRFKIKPGTLGFFIARNASDVASPEEEKEWESELEQQRMEQDRATLDSTGMFHWCTPFSLEDVTLTRESASRLNLKDHVVACVFGDRRSTPLGLGDFMMPLRASSLTGAELRTVIFLGDCDYLSREWHNIHYFPKVYFLPGSPLCGADLRALNVERSTMCVVLCSLSPATASVPFMQDNDTILSCFNLYHLRFPHVLRTTKTAQLTLPHVIAGRPSQGQESGPPAGQSPWAFPRGTSLGQAPTCRESFSQPQKIPEAVELLSEHSSGATIPLLIELVNSSNVRFVNEADSHVEFTSLTLTQAFSTGNVFSVDLLDCLMAATYFNANVPGLVSTLVTGGETPILEAQLAEDNQLRGGESSQTMWPLRQRSKMAQLALQEEPLCRLQCWNFKGLFCQSLDQLEILCIGLYRLVDQPNPCMKRFVITNPPPDLQLLPSDWVFCSVPFQQSYLLHR